MNPTYVTFEQAKKLKEKGFDEECSNYYTPIGKEYIHGWGESIENEAGFSTNEHNPLFVFSYKDFTKEQREKYALAPEQWQVVEWLRVNHGIWIYVLPYSVLFRPYAEELIDENRFGKWEGHKYYSPQEAYSSAFDYILNNLI